MTAIKRIFTAMIACALLVAPGATAWAEGYTVYAGRDNAMVYDAGGDAVAALPMNTKLTLTGVKGNVCQVSYKGKTGYMNKSDLAKQTSAESGAAQMSKTAYVAKDGAKVYSAKGKVLAKLDVNTQVTVTAVKGDICRIKAGGRTGYMNRSDLASSPVTEEVQTMNRTAYVSVDGAKVYSAKGKVLAKLDINTQVTVTAASGKLCRISVGGKTGYMSADNLSSKKVGQAEAAEDAEPQVEQNSEAVAQSSATPARGTAKEMDWWTSDIQKIFARGTTATITDVETGLAWKEQRRGGTNHADVQPLTAADTAVLKRVYGGAWSWARRAIYVTIDGVNYAASMNGMPHGGGSISGNNFNGHHCIHFTNSRTHGSNRVCELHQAAIQKALQAVL